MKIHWEHIRWETDDLGTSWATVADEEHNSLTLENRDGTITFHTDGDPRFDVGTILDITALCAVLSRNALGQIGGPPHSTEPPRSSSARTAGMLVPEQRHTPLTQDDEVEPKVRRLPWDGSTAYKPGRAPAPGRRPPASRRSVLRLPGPTPRPAGPLCARRLNVRKMHKEIIRLRTLRAAPPYRSYQLPVIRQAIFPNRTRIRREIADSGSGDKQRARNAEYLAVPAGSAHRGAR
jgi:hypothetical protein